VLAVSNDAFCAIGAACSICSVRSFRAASSRSRGRRGDGAKFEDPSACFLFNVANARLIHIVLDMPPVLESHEAEILRRVVDPQRAGWSVETARAILSLGLPPGDEDRVNALAEKACDGELSPEETRELEDYRRVGRLLELMKSRARLSMKSAGPA